MYARHHSVVTCHCDPFIYWRTSWATNTGSLSRRKRSERQRSQRGYFEASFSPREVSSAPWAVGIGGSLTAKTQRAGAVLAQAQ